MKSAPVDHGRLDSELLALAGRTECRLRWMDLGAQALIVLGSLAVALASSRVDPWIAASFVGVTVGGIVLQLTAVVLRVIHQRIGLLEADRAAGGPASPSRGIGG